MSCTRSIFMRRALRVVTGAPPVFWMIGSPSIRVITLLLFPRVARLRFAFLAEISHKNKPR